MRARRRIGAAVALGAVVTGAVALPSAPVQADPYVPTVPSIVSRPDGPGQAVQASGLGDRLEMADSGNEVVFVTEDHTLTAGDGNGKRDVYWKQFSTGDVEIVSLGVAGVQPNQHSSSPTISGDGRYVAFVTTANNLGIADGNGVADVYVRDRQTDTTTLGSAGHAPDTGGGEPSLSQDGRYLAFTSNGNVYLRDRTGGTTVEVSVNSNEVSANGPCGGPSVSDDGTRVAFTCQAAATNMAISDTNGAPDVFLRFVGTGDTTRVSVSNASQQLPAGGWGGRISGDGQTVGFISSSPAIAGGVNLGTELYLRQLGFGTILGSRADGTTTTGGAPGVVQAFDLSDDGQGVVFQATPGTWQAFPTSAPSDIYTHDRAEGCTFLSSTAGRKGGGGASRAPAASFGTGYIVWSSTASDMNPDDANGAVEDIFHVQQYCPPEQPFPDVPYSHPFFTEITWMVSRNLTTGYPDGQFKPANAVSRQAMASFLWRLKGTPPPSGPAPTFTDVPEGHPHRQAIWWMVGAGLANGYPDNTFGTTKPVSRQAMAAFLYRLSGSPSPFTPVDSFSDVGDTHPFRDAILWLALVNVVEGYSDGTFRPSNPVSRQAAAAFLQRYDALGPKK